MNWTADKTFEAKLVENKTNSTKIIFQLFPASKYIYVFYAPVTTSKQRRLYKQLYILLQVLQKRAKFRQSVEESSENHIGSLQQPNS